MDAAALSRAAGTRLGALPLPRAARSRPPEHRTETPEHRAELQDLDRAELQDLDRAELQDMHRASPPSSAARSVRLPEYIYCSAEAACETLECGKPWSIYDANGCRRTECQSGTDCPKGSRCVASAITGNFEAGCFTDYDSCDDASGACSCVRYECYRQALCLSEDEFPIGAECPIAGLDCDALARADAGLRAYEENIEIDDATPTEADVEACQAKIAAALATCSG